MKRYLAGIRYRDILVVQWSPLMGVAFTLREVTLDTIGRLLIFSLAGFLLVAHVFAVNDWAGLEQDSRDPHKQAKGFLKQGISRQKVGRLALTLGFVSLLLFTLLSVRTFVLATGVLLFGLLYSHPFMYAKGIPLVSSGVHLVGVALHFLLGYSLFGAIDRRGVLISLYVGLVATAGHLNHEVRDYEGDRRNAILTNAVRFGKEQAFCAGFLLFTLSYGYLFLLARSGLVPSSLGGLVALYPIHALLSWRAFRAGLTFERVHRFQVQYRLLYALIGFTMGTAVFFS